MANAAEFARLSFALGIVTAERTLRNVLKLSLPNWPAGPQKLASFVTKTHFQDLGYCVFCLLNAFIEFLYSKAPFQRKEYNFLFNNVVDKSFRNVTRSEIILSPHEIENILSFQSGYSIYSLAKRQKFRRRTSTSATPDRHLDLHFEWQ